jgi:hypothetical protein
MLLYTSTGDYEYGKIQQYRDNFVNRHKIPSFQNARKAVAPLFGRFAKYIMFLCFQGTVPRGDWDFSTLL